MEMEQKQVANYCGKSMKKTSSSSVASLFMIHSFSYSRRLQNPDDPDSDWK